MSNLLIALYQYIKLSYKTCLLWLQSKKRDSAYSKLSEYGLMISHFIHCMDLNMKEKLRLKVILS